MIALLSVLQCIPCSDFGHIESQLSLALTGQTKLYVSGRKPCQLTVHEASQGPFPLFVLFDLGMAKASVCCSTCAVSFKAETKPALLGFAGNEAANYMANLHAPM